MAKKKGSVAKKIAIAIFVGFVFLMILAAIGSQIETDENGHQQTKTTTLYIKNNCNVELRLIIMVNDNSYDSCYVPSGDLGWIEDVCTVGQPMEIGIVGDYHVEYVNLNNAPEKITFTLHQDGSVTYRT